MWRRSGPADWPGGDAAWREFRSKEPFNAHSHLIAIALGTSESVPITKGAMRIGTYQNIIVVSPMLYVTPYLLYITIIIIIEYCYNWQCFSQVDADGANGGKKRSIAVQITGSK